MQPKKDRARRRAEQHRNVKAGAGHRSVDWTLSGEGRAAIAGYQPDGLQLFFPNPQR